ncbi:MAG: serine/threonine-protein kinase [Lachnospiraceae bacterium]|nr:serine/threonine-protein kinase [Lachnospiraceae bacterium]
MLLKPGTVLAGRYLILKPLGKGGEGSVWLAVHQKTEQLWAVKEIVRAGNEDGLHELNMMKKLNHASLPRVLDVLEDEVHIYLIMEYVRGNTLEKVVKKQGHLSVEQVLDIGIQLCSALTYLHTRAKPVYHLDIKPANLIWEKTGRLVLVDFGAAWRGSNAAGEELRCTRNGLGTEGYAAPEQYDLSELVDARTDIYGLGASLYHLISGVRYSKAMKKSRIPGCQDKLGTVIKKCVSESPKDRYESCRKLQKELLKIRKQQDYQKRRYQLGISVLLAVFAAGVAFRELPREFLHRNGQDWNYEKLLAEALCVPWEEGYEYYQRAVLLEPENQEAYLQILEHADQDGVFSKEEELLIRKLLHQIPLGQEKTYEEFLEQNQRGYGEFAGRMGTVYWYEYEGDGGRTIAAGWFAKALKSLEKAGIGESEIKEHGSKENGINEKGVKEDGESWILQTEVFAKISSYYDRLGQKDESGRIGNVAGEYWSDLDYIYQKKLEEKMNPVMKLRFWEETVNQIIFLAEDFQKAGISVQAMLSRIEEIVQKADGVIAEPKNLDLENELKKAVSIQAGTAREIVERLRKAAENQSINGGMG